MQAGIPVEIKAKEAFEQAKITFTYDENKLGNIKEENLAVMWYNEEEDWYYLMDETSRIDTNKNTVSYISDHFSTYMLVDREQWYNIWNTEIDYRSINEQSLYYDIAFIVDTSGSMDEAIGKTKEALNTYVERLYCKDRAGVVCFSREAEVLCGLDSTRETLIERIDSLFASGGTDTDAGLKKGLQLLSTSANVNKRIAILICDGDVNYVQNTVDEAIKKGVKIYTLNVGCMTSSSELKKMSSQTGGEYFFCKYSSRYFKSFIRNTT